MTAPWKPSAHDDGNPFATPYLRYFDAEMRYLRAAADEFARAHPEAAQRLGIGTGDLDGPLRATCEGFAFLMARLRMKLDDGMPELTAPLVDGLYAHAARTIPSLAMVELAPQPGTVRAAALLPAGAVIRSAPAGAGQVQCVFRTTQPVQLLPLSVHDAATVTRPDGRTVIRLTFALHRMEQRDHIDLSRVRLYLHGDRATASALYAALTREVTTIGLRLPSVGDGRLQTLGAVRFEPAGFGPSTRLWPIPDVARDATVDHEQTLLEYFVFPQKFHVVDLCGFDPACVPAAETHCTFEIEIGEPVANLHRVGPRNFRLFCTPAINLFDADALPLQPRDVHDREHHIRMPAHLSRHVEPFDVVSIRATDAGDSRRHVYRSATTTGRSDARTQRVFHQSTQYGPLGRELRVTLAGPLWERPDDHDRDDATTDMAPDRHLAVRVRVHNGTLPRTSIAEATALEPVSGLTGIASVHILTSPTLPAHPPRHHPDYDWRVLGHFAADRANELTMIGVAGADVLRDALRLYDWSSSDDVAQRIEAIEHVALAERVEIERCGLHREIGIRVQLDADAFAGPGDVALFGDVLSRFVGRYACIHHSTRLTVIASGKETVYPRNERADAPF